jgi:hypothetical protein
MTTMGEAAAEYAARGWRVLPLHTPGIDGCSCAKGAECGSAGKHPRTTDGVSGASADPEVVRAWWRRWPDANVGIATGPESGFFVLDSDHAKVGEASAISALAELEDKHGRLPPTLSQRTGSGGHHRLYRWSDEVPVKSRKRVLFCGEVPSAVDTRGIGGYIVAPPSLHSSGRRYEWRAGPAAVDEPTEAPRWLLDAVTATRSKGLPLERVAAPLPALGAEADRAERYVRAALLGACARLSGAVAGGRHEAILREGRTLGGWAHLSPAIGAEVIEAALVDAALAAGVERKEAVRTVHDAVAHGMLAPRDLPPAPERPERVPERKVRDVVEDVGGSEADWLVESQPDDYAPWGEDVVGDDVPPDDRAMWGRRRVVITGRQPSEVVADARAALAHLQGPGQLYLRDQRIVQVVVSEHGPAIREVGVAELTSALVDAAEWVELRAPRAREMTAGEDLVEQAAKALPGYVVPAVMGTRAEWLPRLSRVSTGPYFDAVGRLVSAGGYDAGSSGYLASGLNPEPMEIGAAVGVLDEWIGQFPFERPSDRAHALAFALTPLVRDMVRGPVPMTVFEAPSPGTGKSLLMQVLASAATGRPVEPTPMSGQEDERRKAMGSLLAEGRPVVLLDNVRGHLHDPALEGVLTAYPTWSDRRMGGQDRLRVPATAVWGLSGNNLTMNADLQRRTVSVRLNARCARPEARTGWRHPDLLGYTASHADRLLSALIALVEAWRGAGCPLGTATLGSYEAWAGLLGGILDVAGVVGFLGDRAERIAEVDPETAEWAGLLHAWMGEPALRGRRPAGDLARVCAERGLLLGVLGDGSAMSQARRLGAALGRMRGRVLSVDQGEVEVVGAGALHGRPMYELRLLRAPVVAMRAAD